MIEIYEGEGKGKTTAACGLAVRAAGRGIPVVFAQFLKDGTSGELNILREIPGVRVMVPDGFHGFVSRMSEEDRAACGEACRRLLREIGGITARRADSGSGETCPVSAGSGAPGTERRDGESCGGVNPGDVRCLVVLDEILHAFRYGFADEEAFLALADRSGGGVEFVLTGREPSDRILERADYITEFVCRRHPYDRGVRARRGIEY